MIPLQRSLVVLGALLCVIPSLEPALANDPPGPASAAGSASSDLSSADLESLLNTKVITASKFSENVSGAPGVIRVVTKDELKRFGGLTLREILERVAGLTGSTASFTDRSIISARGDQTQINGGHILFLINGRPTREVLEGGIISDLMEAFPVSILERIEVVEGPGSVLYGSDAFSAVVNLITQKATANELVVTGQGGPEGAASGSGNVFLKHGDLSIAGAGQFHQYPVWATLVSTTYAGFENSLIPDRSKGGYLDLDYKGLSIMSSYTDWTTSYIEGVVGVARWRRGFVDAGYHLKAASRWDMNFNFTYTRATLDAQQSIPFITRDSYEALGEWSNEVTVGERDRITFGTLYDYRRGAEDFYAAGPAYAISDGSHRGGAFYAQDDHELTKSIQLIGGFQANKIENISLNVVPRGGIVWTPTSRWSVKALYSQAFRAPSLNETLLHYIPPPAIGGPSLIGNPNLVPEKVATIDAEIRYQGNRFEGSVDYFHSRQTDIIVLANVTTAGTYMNLGSAAFDGAEAEGKYYFRKYFYVTGSVTHLFDVAGDGSGPITPVSTWSAKAGISYESSNGLTVGLFDVFEGSAGEGYAAALNPKPVAYSLLNANFRLDLSKHLHLNGPGLALVAHGENLANTAVWLPDWKDVPGDTIFLNRGRAIFAGIEFSLKKD
ncbi:MAG TPA: TonB-dependent receptor [Bryobacteraceae bacterium]|nr:TonB-dependent receptor [Bryobacteraceae bacterium]